MVSVTAFMTSAAACDPVWIAWTDSVTLVVAREVCAASALTSPATTVKPRPASPARAASMVALRASRWVWLAIELIRATTFSISREERLQLADGAVGGDDLAGDLVGDGGGQRRRGWQPRGSWRRAPRSRRRCAASSRRRRWRWLLRWRRGRPWSRTSASMRPGDVVDLAPAGAEPVTACPLSVGEQLAQVVHDLADRGGDRLTGGGCCHRRWSTVRSPSATACRSRTRGRRLAGICPWSTVRRTAG